MNLNTNEVQLITRLIDNGMDQKKPIIYMWEIYTLSGEFQGCYVGKSKNGAKRPLKAYNKNVGKMLSTPVKPYRKNNPNGYRKVYHALKNAHKQGYRITLTFLCNVNELENIDKKENDWIREKNCKGNKPCQLNGFRDMELKAV